MIQVGEGVVVTVKWAELPTSPQILTLMFLKGVFNRTLSIYLGSKKIIKITLNACKIFQKSCNSFHYF